MTNKNSWHRKHQALICRSDLGSACPRVSDTPQHQLAASWATLTLFFMTSRRVTLRYVTLHGDVFRVVTPCNTAVGNGRFTLKTEAARYSESSVSFRNITRCHNTEDIDMSHIALVWPGDMMQPALHVNVDLSP